MKCERHEERGGHTNVVFSFKFQVFRSEGLEPTHVGCYGLGGAGASAKRSPIFGDIRSNSPIFAHSGKNYFVVLAYGHPVPALQSD